MERAASHGAAPTGSDVLDFAFVNCTTLGYGDLTPRAGWRLRSRMSRFSDAA